MERGNNSSQKIHGIKEVRIEIVEALRRGDPYEKWCKERTKKTKNIEGNKRTKSKIIDLSK